jgi:outer membrane biogenesis lipoprotein LolB
LSLRLYLRLFKLVFASILFFTGCSSFSGPEPAGLPPSQVENLRLSGGDYALYGRILFKHPEGQHSGELALQISRDSELKLSIFTPLIGSLIYELRASSKIFMILNYQQKNFVLAENNQEVRRTWLGMDLTLTELKWLILGKLPEKTPYWQRKILPNGELRLRKDTTEIHIRFNDSGQIEAMQKSLEGLLEYRAVIPLYQKHYKLLFPRKISIEDYSENNKWLMVFNEIQTPATALKPLDFNAPPEMRPLQSE